MLKIALAFALAALFGTAAFAQTVNGELGYAQMLLAMPNLTQDRFLSADLDGSGGLNAEEIRALQMRPNAVSNRPKLEVDSGVDPSSSGQTSSTGL